ncbi:MAG: biopolymer transporter ExbD [Deltaproteobacteria bacterium]|nr:biopolymer transporter ExbD [Deltaproteobacteria bacterium]
MGGSPISPSSGARRPLDAELNLVPFIDLLVCCICFLLITAVWSQMARVEVHVGAERGVRQQRSLSMSQARVAVLVDHTGYVLTAGSQRVAIPRQGRLYDRQRLKRELHTIRAHSATPPAITVAVTDGVPFQHVVAVIDVAKAQRFGRVRLSDGDMRL